MFVPLDARSAFSLGAGILRPAELAKVARRLGYPSLALTDVENLYGQFEFHRTARAAGVRPILGVTLESPAPAGDLFASSGRLILLARDETGYASLCRIISERRLGTSVSTWPARELAANAAGLFVLCDHEALLRQLLKQGVPRACLRGLIVRPSADPMQENAVRSFCAREDVAVAADLDVLLAEPADLPLYELRVAIAMGMTVQQVREAQLAAVRERLLRSPEEVARLFSDIPGAVEETARIAEACDTHIFDAAAVIAPAPVTPGDPDARLRARCLGAFTERWPIDHPAYEAYRDRLQEELGLIALRGLSGYFLVVDEIAGAARRMGVGVAARGSAVSSLVVYLLGISRIDPLSEGLVFERFLNPLRQDVPDVDLDVASDQRAELIDWAYRHFGADRTATVGSMHAFQVRTAYREGLKALGMPASAVNAFVSRIRDRPGDAEPPLVPVERLPEAYRTQAPLIERLIGLPHHFAAHPGGLVIAPEPLERLVPLERAANGVVATQFDRRAVRKRGLVKIDLLGNHALAELGMVSRLLEPGNASAAHWSGIPLDDGQTLDLLNRADTIGCFQVESPAVRSTLRRMRIHSIGDVAVALALVRPGAASGQAKRAFLQRAAGLETPDHRHPAVSEVLRATHGLLLFEEDIIRLIQAVTGRSAARADHMRAAILRGDPSRRTAAVFSREAAPLLGRAEAQRTWRELDKMAAYTFSRAHASSYAILAYLVSYVKLHHPAAFTCALIEHHGGLYPLRSVVSEMIRRGVAVLLPAVNASGHTSTLERGAVRIGLDRIKHVPKATVEDVLAGRAAEGPFSSLDDFVRRVQPSRRALEALVLSGACDGLAPLDPSRYPFPHEDAVIGRTEVLADLHDADAVRYQRLVRIRNELRFLEMHVTDHPMRVLRPDADALGLRTTESAGRDGEHIRIAGVVAAARLARVASSTLQFVTLEDEYGTIECTVPPGTLRRIGNRITTPGPFLAEGVLREDLGDLRLEIASMMPFHERLRGLPTS